jgi:hypothetical protein
MFLTAKEALKYNLIDEIALDIKAALTPPQQKDENNEITI